MQVRTTHVPPAHRANTKQRQDHLSVCTAKPVPQRVRPPPCTSQTASVSRVHSRSAKTYAADAPSEVSKIRWVQQIAHHALQTQQRDLLAAIRSRSAGVCPGQAAAFRALMTDARRVRRDPTRRKVVQMNALSVRLGRQRPPLGRRRVLSASAHLAIYRSQDL